MIQTAALLSNTLLTPMQLLYYAVFNWEALLTGITLYMKQLYGRLQVELLLCNGPRFGIYLPKMSDLSFES